MKYWVEPTIYRFTGIALGAMFLGLMIFILPSVHTQDGKVMVVALGACAFGIMGLFGHLSDNVKLIHHKRILQKAGLWTDERIKGKDLPKQEDK